MNRHKIEIILWVITIIFLCFYYTWEHFQNRKLEKSPLLTTGTVIDYYVIFPESHYLTYEYVVAGKHYQNKINPNPIMEKCVQTQNCIGRKYEVIYVKTDPSISKILLDKPIDN